MTAPDRSSPRTGLLLLALALAFAAGIGLLLDPAGPDPGGTPDTSSVVALVPRETLPSAPLRSPPSSSAPLGPRASSPRASGTPAPLASPTPTQADFLDLECLVTLDGVAQEGAVLRVLLPRGVELRFQSDPQGRAVLRLPRDRYARILPSIPSLGLEAAQVELLPRGEPLEIRALSSQKLLEIGDVLGGYPPGGPEDEGQGFDLAEVFVPTEGSPGVLRVAFSSGAELRGRVLDAQGGPVAGARVSLAADFESSSEPLPGAFSDGEGRFAVKLDAQAALDLVRVQAETEGGSGSAEPERREAGLGFEPLTIRLRAGEAFRGRVSDLEGRPLSARVSAEVGVFSEETWAATCDSDGRFWFGALAEKGHWTTATLSVSCEGYAVQSVEVSQGSGAPLLEVRLTPLTRCRGRVLSARGEPVAGARVVTLFDPQELNRRYGPANGGPDLDALATDAFLTDGQGRFDFETPAGPRLLLVSAEGHGERVVATSLQESTLEVRLLPASVVAGAVHTTGGEPLDYRLLILVPTGYEPPENLYEDGPAQPLRGGPSRALPTREVPTAVSATVAREGRFRFENVPPGRYDVYGRAIVWGSFSPRLVARGVSAGQLDVRAVFEPPPVARLEFSATQAGQPLTAGACEFAIYDAAGKLLTTARPGAEGKVEVELWAFGALVVEARGFGFRTNQRRVELRAGEARTLAPFDLDPRVGTVSVLVTGFERYSSVSVSGKDPESGHWVEAAHAMGGEERLLSFPPGPAQIRVRAYGREEVLAEVVREVQVDLDQTTPLRIDLGATGR